MGQKLAEFYRKADKLGGQKAKMHLAMITCVPSMLAMNFEDSPENISRFELAYKEVQKEYV
jgi:hypothetical protein